jgi:hypothetical protein
MRGGDFKLDIVARLRRDAKYWHANSETGDMEAMAADEIEQLRELLRSVRARLVAREVMAADEIERLRSELARLSADRRKCKYMDAVPPPSACVIRDGAEAIIWVTRGNINEEECVGCARTSEQMGGDWLNKDAEMEQAPDSQKG